MSWGLISEPWVERGTDYIHVNRMERECTLSHGWRVVLTIYMLQSGDIEPVTDVLQWSTSASYYPNILLISSVGIPV